ncbi:flagellar motor switch protein FliN [Persephonella sp. KM09-Lau-8]|uniref:flagellar motor switch protein FliN n=1 Tax=Persephonella sp. KM09-Lau-8 TaxID=1158345 RepID=UPI000497E426|nr:flagellar motor switch protein FliN [Persephonella sp. KM09-Lau-8]
MSEEEKKENQSEEVDQEKLAEEWAKMAEAGSSETEEGSQEESVDQEKLAEEWAKMAEGGESSESESSEEVDQEKLAEEWAKMAEGESSESSEVNQEELAKEWEQMAAQPEKPVEMAEFEKEKLDLLMDIPLEISVEIGSTKMPLEEILKLNPNSIVELDRYIDQPVDIKVNGKLIAKGQLYTVENNFGIKITSIITVQERMKLLSNDEM